MRPSFQPRLINGPFEDPGLIVPLNFRRQAFLFDLGDIRALSAREILKTSHVFVTHTHIDHFIGFDHLLRLLLGRNKRIRLFGPAGFLDNVAGKLKGYTWNLVHNYDTALTLEAAEIGGNTLLRQTFHCHNGFESGKKRYQSRPGNLSEDEPALKVTAAVLDHQIPCLGFAVSERFHVNIKKTALETMGLRVGPWLNAFKARLFEQADPDSLFQVPPPYAKGPGHTFRLGELSRRVTRITPGHKVAYIADAAYTPENEAAIVALAENADQLFIEAAFLQKDSAAARIKNHLTAHQAGTIARKAGVRQMVLFHHSPRYLGKADLLHQEARQAFLCPDKRL